MIGLKRGAVKLVQHDTTWNDLFEREKALIQKVLSKDVLGVEHIGSTSIPNIVAKPIIDIEVGIASTDNLHAIEEIGVLLNKLGYEWRRQNSNPDNHIFAKGSEDNRTVYLHIVECNGNVWKSDLLFRNYLRQNPLIAAEYEKIKINLAEKYPDDRESYTKGKKNFIQQILRSAKNL